MRALALRTAKTLRLPLIAAVAAVLAYLAWMGLAGSLSAFERPALPVLDDAALGDRILVIAPHPDDETLGPGGLIHRSVGEGKRVTVVVVTCGDGFRRIVGSYRSGTASPFLNLGEVRAGESREAMKVLGLPSADLHLLGYPDGSMASVWNGGWDTPAVGVNGTSTVPYPFAFRPGASYTASDVVGDLASIIASVAPTAVIYPDAEDSNADHWAVNAFTELTLDKLRSRARRYTYLVHRGHFPFPWSYVPNDWILPPRTLSRLGTRWFSSPLSSAEERLKEAALQRYRSQQRAIEPFLAAFVRRNELFAEWHTPTVPDLPREHVSLEASSMPGIVVRDPAADTLLRVVDAGGDLLDVALFRQGDRMWIGVQTRGAPVASMTYRVSLRLLRQQAVPSRLDIAVHRGRAEVVDAGQGSLLAADVVSEVGGKRVWVSVPASVFAGVREGVLSATSWEGGTAIDRTASRPFLLR